jgi:hypothetical protein
MRFDGSKSLFDQLPVSKPTQAIEMEGMRLEDL